MAIRFPGVQTKVAQKATDYLSRTIDHQVTVGRVDIEFFSKVVLEKVRVSDIRNNELFYVGRAEADISVFSIFDPNTLHIATLELQEPRANLVKYAGTDSLNLTTFIAALSNLTKKDTTETAQPFNFTIDELIVRNGTFTYDDFNDARTEYGMDYSHLSIHSLSGRFSEIELDDTLRVRVQDLTAHETRSDARLHKLDTRMTYAPTFWEFDDLDLRLNRSNLQHYVRFDYSTFGDFTEFIDSVTLTTRFHNSAVYSKDIAIFAPQLREYNESAFINTGEFKGLVSDFNATNLDLRYGKNTHIVGSVSADGLPNFKETFANLKLAPSTINAADLKQILPEEAYTVVERLGNVDLEGRFLGFYNDFVANGTFATQLGRVESDINLKIDDNRNSSYRGYLKTTGFNLGKLIGDTDIVKTVSMEGRLSGSGFTLEDARIQLNATIQQLHLLNYNYRNIKADGSLSRQKFVGQVAVNDPNLIFSADGEVVLAANNQAFNMVANLQRVDLRALQITSDSLTISADANLNFSGLRLDDFAGLAQFSDAQVIYKGKPLAIDTLFIESRVAEGQRSLSLNSDLLTLNVAGDFDYSVLIQDMKQLVHEYKLNFESNDAATQAYYKKKSVFSPSHEYSLNYDLYLKHVNPALQLFVPDLAISDFTRAEGSFSHGNTIIFNMFAELDTVVYGNFNLYQNSLELNTSKLQHSPDVLASILFTSERQLLPAGNNAQDFYLEGIWNERTIEFSTSVRQPELNNRATVSGDLNFLEDQIQLVFDRSNITLQGTPWVFAPENTVFFSDAGKAIRFENFIISNHDQSLSAQGVISEEPDSRLMLNINNFNLRNLNTLLPMPIAGRLTADVELRDIYDAAIVNAAIRADSFRLEEILIGNITGKTNWNSTLQQMAVDVGIDYDNKKVLTITGNYKPQEAEEQLDMLAIAENAHLKLVEPVLRPIMSGLEGSMEGRIRILGPLRSPVLTGSMMVNNGQFNFDYLGTTYHFTDRVYFGPNSISFRNARLRDIYGNYATVTGGIAHDGFQDMVLDMEARYRNFMVLNTTNEQNDLYYGTAFATGTASILGPVDNLNLKVAARSEPNTRIVLPFDNQVDVTRKDFIRFVNRNAEDTTAVEVAAEEQRVDLSGINMDFDLDVTDDAYLEIIIDRQTGDIIRGSGNGQIKMTIDTRGEFNMSGGIEIATGAYNLNLLEGLVSREFRVVPGGTISWNGDPLAGIMDLRATYTQVTSLSGIVQDIQGRYPVTAIVDLKGELLTPEIKLGLSFDEVPQDIASLPQVSSFVNVMRSDENELNRQVFSLLVLRRLTSPGTFAFGDAGGTGVGAGSLGNLLSSQLSGFLNNIDSNLEIDIGIEGIDQNALANLQVRLSYTFFDGRLRVTSQSGLTTNSAATGATGTGRNYQGDWSLEYYITQSGELRARLEYNTQPRPFDRGIVNRQRISILHTKRFDSIRELFGSRGDRRERRRDREREPIILDSDPRINL